jgi:hypothetical protein
MRRDENERAALRALVNRADSGREVAGSSEIEEVDPPVEAPVEALSEARSPSVGGPFP